MRRDLHEYMDVIARQGAVDDRHTHLGAHLPDDLAHPEPHLALEHLEPVLRRPDDVIAVMKSRVATGGISPARQAGLRRRAGSS